MTTRPNVLVFVSHDTGRCIGPDGYPTFATPALERFAAQGVRCAKAFCTAPLCSPSRASLFTGRYPHQNGVDGLVGPTRGFALYPTERHAAALFAAAGYESALCGMVHETDQMETLGFETVVYGPGAGFNDSRDADLLAYGEAIGGWLAERDGERPFYLQIGCGDTHRDWGKRAAPDDSRGVWQPPWLQDSDEVRQEIRAFQGGVARLDEGIGRILAALDAAGQAERTIVVLTTDHGADLPLAKGTLRDPGLEVFLLLRHPTGGWGAGRVIDDLVSQVDVLPTLLEACDLPVPEHIAGRSLLPRLSGRSDGPHRTAIYAEKTFHDFYDPRRCLRTGRYKYIHYFDVNPYQDLRKATMTRQHQCRLSPIRPSPEELFDCQADPLEGHNLADDPAQAERLAELRQQLAAWMAATDDPLLDGPMESPLYRKRREALRVLAGCDR